MDEVRLESHEEERAFANGFDVDQYKASFLRLFSQYKSLKPALDQKHGGLDQFIIKYAMNCPLAQSRISEGVPSGATPSTGNSLLKIHQTTGILITASNAIQMGLDVGNLKRELKEITIAFRNFNIPANSELEQSLRKIKSEYVDLEDRPLTEQLGENDRRKLANAVEECQRAFEEALAAGLN